MTAAHAEEGNKRQGASESNQKMSSKRAKQRITQFSLIIAEPHHLESFVDGVVLVVAVLVVIVISCGSRRTSGSSCSLANSGVSH